MDDKLGAVAKEGQKGLLLLAELAQHAAAIHHVRLFVSARLIQPVNGVFLSQQISTS